MKSASEGESLTAVHPCIYSVVFLKSASLPHTFLDRPRVAKKTNRTHVGIQETLEISCQQPLQVGLLVIARPDRFLVELLLRYHALVIRSDEQRLLDSSREENPTQVHCTSTSSVRGDFDRVESRRDPGLLTETGTPCVYSGASSATRTYGQGSGVQKTRSHSLGPKNPTAGRGKRGQPAPSHPAVPTVLPHHASGS